METLAARQSRQLIHTFSPWRETNRGRYLVEGGERDDGCDALHRIHDHLRIIGVIRRNPHGIAVDALEALLMAAKIADRPMFVSISREDRVSWKRLSDNDRRDRETLRRGRGLRSEDVHGARRLS
jgi:hypothetical protein